ncbi:hypothetical protein AA0112_g7764 [Alternaria arborescens]|nr:hypothetical protein AA0112_g7764 [Alternaria arborescens]
MAQVAQSEWNVEFQRYIVPLWSAEHGRYYWQHYVEGQGWTFFDWAPFGWTPSAQNFSQSLHSSQAQSHARTDSVQTVTSSSGGPAGYGRGETIQGSYQPENPYPNSHYEVLDPSFYVRSGAFFEEGKVFAVLFTETAGANAINPMADYNTSLSRVKYNEFAHTQVRRFIVTKSKREFCFAVPIFSYGNRGTTKHGVVPDEHAIAYSLGMQPQLVSGEAPLVKAPIPIVMDTGAPPLAVASRIYFAIHHPIQYNVKVKSLGYVHPDYLPTFLGYWNQENFDSKQDPEVTQNTNNTDGA